MINNDNSSKLIGKRIKESRKNANMTQAELGKALGNLSYQMIGQYESGSRKPKRERIEEIAKILDVNPRYLTGESDRPKGSFAIVKKDGTRNYIDTSKILSAINKSFPDFRKTSDILFDNMVQEIVLRNALPEQDYDNLMQTISPHPDRTPSYRLEAFDAMKELNEDGWKELTRYAKYLAMNPEYRNNSDTHEPTEEK